MTLIYDFEKPSTKLLHLIFPSLHSTKNILLSNLLKEKMKTDFRNVALVQIVFCQKSNTYKIYFIQYKLIAKKFSGKADKESQRHASTLNAL